MDIIFATAIFIIVVALYLLPTIIAVTRIHHNAMAICALNVLLGWTLLGWVAALVWALTNQAERRI